MRTTSGDELAWTGERLTTAMTSDIIVHHLHRYALAMKLGAGKSVLDIASGEGYGSHLISGTAESVTGVDISAEAVAFASRKYRKSNLVFLEGPASAIPAQDHSFDVIVSFETIEHHDQHEEMMREFKRVLKPGGIVLISSPDKLNYTDVPGYQNPYHVKELYAGEFHSLVQKHFAHTKNFSQNLVYGSVITTADARPSGYSQFEGNFDAISERTAPVSVFNICLASNDPIPEGLFSDTSFFHSAELLNTLENTAAEIHNSKTYKAGLVVTYPFRLLRKAAGLFRK